MRGIEDRDNIIRGNRGEAQKIQANSDVNFIAISNLGHVLYTTYFHAQRLRHLPYRDKLRSLRGPSEVFEFFWSHFALRICIRLD